MGIAERRRSSRAASTRGGGGGEKDRFEKDGFAISKSNENNAHPTQPWHRILYERQPFPDNHTDESFLERLVLNGRVVPRQLSTVVFDASTVSQQIAVVAVKGCVTFSLMEGSLDAMQVLVFTFALLVLGLAVTIVAKGILYTLKQALRIGPLMVVTLAALTPLFQTMTSAVSNDTATCCAVCALLVHLFFHEYFESSASSDSHGGGSNPNEREEIRVESYAETGDKAGDTEKVLGADSEVPQKVRATVSIGASMFATSVLASRLVNSVDVFADVFLSTVLFVLFPFASRFLSRERKKTHCAGVAGSHVLAPAAITHVSSTAAHEHSDKHPHEHSQNLTKTLVVTYATTIIFVTLACPAALVRLMRYKKQINGPWDEAGFILEARDATRRGREIA